MNVKRWNVLAATVAVVLSAAASVPAGAAAIERTVPLEPGGSLRIEIPAGDVRILGWDRAEVAISGTFTGDPARVEIDADGDEVSIEVDPVRDERSRLDVEIRVPRLRELDVEALACRLTVEGVAAEDVDIEIIDGDVRFAGTARSLDVESVSGAVVVDGAIDSVDVESAAGDVEILGVRREVDVESAAGQVRVVAGGPLAEVDLATVSGNLAFEGGLTPDGEMRIETLNGNTDLALDPGTAATVDVETFNGRIAVDWEGVEIDSDRDRDDDGHHAGHDRGHRHPGRSERFTLGTGGARIRVETFNGNCTIRRR